MFLFDIRNLKNVTEHTLIGENIQWSDDIENKPFFLKKQFMNIRLGEEGGSDSDSKTTCDTTCKLFFLIWQINGWFCCCWTV